MNFPSKHDQQVKAEKGGSGKLIFLIDYSRGKWESRRNCLGVERKTEKEMEKKQA